MYAGDRQWWDRYGDACDFRGERWTRDERSAMRYRLRRIEGSDGAGLCTCGGVHLGGNSGYQAINLAYHLGAREIVLLGFDMHRDNGGHWHGEHEDMLSAPESHIAAWVRQFDALARDLSAAGCRVTNATPGSALECFPSGSLFGALR
jgi:hypothetical protein